MDLKKKIGILCQFGYFKELEKYLTTEDGKKEFQSLKHLPMVISCVQGSKRYKGRQGADHAATCVIIVQNGADVNLADAEQRTALHWAVRLKQPSLVGKLIELGGNPTLEDCDGLNACHLSVKLGREECLTTLTQSYSCKKLLDKCDRQGTPPLIHAVKSGSINITNQLLEHNINLDATDRRARRTALHYAYMEKQKQLFDLLIRHGSRPDLPDYKNQRVIHRASSTSDPDYLSAIINHHHLTNVDLNVPTPEGYTPLMTACMSARSSQVSLLLKQPSVRISCVDRAGRTALHYCSGSENTQCAELITDVCDKVTLNMKCENGFTVLNLAIIAGNLALVKLLIERGCNVKNVDCEQHSLLHWATVCGKVAIMQLLLQYCKDDLNLPDCHHAYPLHYAAQMQSNQAVMETLLKSSALVHNVDDEGRMAMQWAASSGNSSSCQLLVWHGAEVNARDKHGLSALHCAASQGHWECINCLVKHCSANVDICDKDGCTPLFYAANNGHLKAVQALLDARARIDICDDRGRGLAHCAAVGGSIPVLNFIHKKGVNLWLPSYKGDLPVHDAALNSQNDVVSWLLEMCPDMIDKGNQLDRTCLHISALTNNKNLCTILLSKGASVNSLVQHKNEKLTAYDVAIYSNHTSLANYIYTQGGLSAKSLENHKTSTNKKVTKPRLFPNLPLVTVSDLTSEDQFEFNKKTDTTIVQLPKFSPTKFSPNDCVHNDSPLTLHKPSTEILPTVIHQDFNTVVPPDAYSNDVSNCVPYSKSPTTTTVHPAFVNSATHENLPASQTVLDEAQNIEALIENTNYKLNSLQEKTSDSSCIENHVDNITSELPVICLNSYSHQLRQSQSLPDQTKLQNSSTNDSPNTAITFETDTYVSDMNNKKIIDMSFPDDGLDNFGFEHVDDSNISLPVLEPYLLNTDTADNKKVQFLGGNSIKRKSGHFNDSTVKKNTDLYSSRRLPNSNTSNSNEKNHYKQTRCSVANQDINKQNSGFISTNVQTVLNCTNVVPITVCDISDTILKPTAVKLSAQSKSPDCVIVNVSTINSSGQTMHKTPGLSDSEKVTMKKSEDDVEIIYRKKPGYYYGASVPVRPKYHDKKSITSLSMRTRSKQKDQNQDRHIPSHHQWKEKQFHSVDGLIYDKHQDKWLPALTRSLTVSGAHSRHGEYTEFSGTNHEHTGTSGGNLSFLRTLLVDKNDNNHPHPLSRTQTTKKPFIDDKVTHTNTNSQAAKERKSHTVDITKSKNTIEDQAFSNVKHRMELIYKTYTPNLPKNYSPRSITNTPRLQSSTQARSMSKSFE